MKTKVLIVEDSPVQAQKLRLVLEEEGWRYSTDSGWNDWDIQIYGNFWWSIALQTVTEYHGGGKCLTRVRLRNRMVVTTIIFNLIAISLLIYHQLNVSHIDLWSIFFYVLFLGFLGFLGSLLGRADARVHHRYGCQKHDYSATDPE